MFLPGQMVREVLAVHVVRLSNCIGVVSALID